MFAVENLGCSRFLSAVVNAIAGRIPASAVVQTAGDAGSYLYAERGNFGLALIPPVRPAGNVPVAVVVQRFDSNEFGSPGWYCWFAGPDGCTADGTDWVWFAPLNATPATVAAVLTVAYGNL